MLPPQIIQPFAQAHDTAITLAFAELLGLGIAHLLLRLRLGLTWADALPILHRQEPTNTATILEHLRSGTAAVPSLQAITEARHQLQLHGIKLPPRTLTPMATSRRPVIPSQLPVTQPSFCTLSHDFYIFRPLPKKSNPWLETVGRQLLPFRNYDCMHVLRRRQKKCW